MSRFTHIDQNGHVRMVDVTGKDATLRTAIARATVCMQPETLKKIINKRVKKGNVLETARIAGIMAAKKTAELIPVCHPLNITHVSVDFAPDEESHLIQIEAGVRLVGQTGVEMKRFRLLRLQPLPFMICVNLMIGK